MCLSIFLEQDISIGKAIALDEAHKVIENPSGKTLILIPDS